MGEQQPSSEQRAQQQSKEEMREQLLPKEKSGAAPKQIRKG